MAESARAHSFFFADLAGFTALTEAMGDSDAVDLAHGFYAAVEELVSDYEAEAVKAIGDAVMVRVDDASDAVALALCVVHDVGGRHFFPTVRAGIHTGPAVERGGDWFGATVNVAARVSGEASGGEVLLTDATQEAATSLDGVELRERGRRELRNVTEPIVLYAALRAGAAASASLPVDPVCRMAVDPEHAVGRLVHEGAEFHFCSMACVGKFAAAPERYTDG